MMIEGDLGHDDDEGPAVGMDANGLGKADLGFVHALRAALAGAMEEEDEGPGLFAVPVLRQIDDVAVEDAVDFERAIEEAGVLEAGGGVGRDSKKGSEKARRKRRSIENRVQGTGDREQ